MRLSKPSPATVIATIALVMATTGTAVAAVSYASNAGRVDGLSAVGASSSNSRAKGNLVATARGGSNPGKIPNKFLADVPANESFEAPFAVEDNATGANVELNGNIFGRLSASCRDQANAAGTEDPRMVIEFSNTSGGTVNIARRVGVGDGTVGALANGTVDSFAINGSNTFRYHLEAHGRQVVIEGAVREDRITPSDGVCFVWGSVQTLD
jgi:hypothetical protein